MRQGPAAAKGPRRSLPSGGAGAAARPGGGDGGRLSALRPAGPPCTSAGGAAAGPSCGPAVGGGPALGSAGAAPAPARPWPPAPPPHNSGGCERGETEAALGGGVGRDCRSLAFVVIA